MSINSELQTISFPLVIANDRGECPSHSRSVLAPCFSRERTVLSAIYIIIIIILALSLSAITSHHHSTTQYDVIMHNKR